MVTSSCLVTFPSFWLCCGFRRESDGLALLEILIEARQAWRSWARRKREGSSNRHGEFAAVFSFNVGGHGVHGPSVFSPEPREQQCRSPWRWTSAQGSSLMPVEYALSESRRTWRRSHRRYSWGGHNFERFSMCSIARGRFVQRVLAPLFRQLCIDGPPSRWTTP